MFGRRKAANSEKFINLAERIRRRAMGSRLTTARQPANDGGLFTARVVGPRIDGLRKAAKHRLGLRGRSATVLSFDKTPVYRAAENSAIKPALLHQVLPVLEDRMECLSYLDGTRAALVAAVDELIDEALADLALRLGQEERRALIAGLLDELDGLGPLELLLADDSVSDIVVDGPKEVMVERRGRRQRTDIAFRGEAHLMRIARRIALDAGRHLDAANPLVNARLPVGHRVSVMVPPLVPDGVAMTIRKREAGSIPLHRMVRQGSLSRDMGVLLALAVGTERNILISGIGDSGRTTLLNALLEIVDQGQRVVTVEEFPELSLHGRHGVRLQARPAAPAGPGALSQRDLVRNAFRMRADRVVLGELQNDGAFDLLEALDSGHRGAMATIHGASPEDALARLETMLGAGGAALRDCRQRIARTVDLIVQVERMADGTRKVTKITEVVGLDVDNILTQDLFTFDQTGEDGKGRVQGTFRETGVAPAFTERDGSHGIGAPLDSTF